MKTKNTWVVLEKTFYEVKGIERACAADTSDIWLFKKKEDAISYIERRLKDKKYDKSQMPGGETSYWETSLIILGVLYRRVYELRKRKIF